MPSKKKSQQTTNFSGSLPETKKKKDTENSGKNANNFKSKKRNRLKSKIKSLSDLYKNRQLTIQEALKRQPESSVMEHSKYQPSKIASIKAAAQTFKYKRDAVKNLGDIGERFLMEECELKNIDRGRQILAKLLNFLIEHGIEGLENADKFESHKAITFYIESFIKELKEASLQDSTIAGYFVIYRRFFKYLGEKYNPYFGKLLTHKYPKMIVSSQSSLDYNKLLKGVENLETWLNRIDNVKVEIFIDSKGNLVKVKGGEEILFSRAFYGLCVLEAELSIQGLLGIKESSVDLILSKIERYDKVKGRYTNNNLHQRVKEALSDYIEWKRYCGIKKSDESPLFHLSESQIRKVISSIRYEANTGYNITPQRLATYVFNKAKKEWGLSDGDIQEFMNLSPSRYFRLQKEFKKHNKTLPPKIPVNTFLKPIKVTYQHKSKK